MTQTEMVGRGVTGTALVYVDGVRVRFDRRLRSDLGRWHCDECGRADAVVCTHTAHAAAVIAQELLELPVTLAGPTPNHAPEHPAPGETQGGTTP